MGTRVALRACLTSMSPARERKEPVSLYWHRASAFSPENRVMLSCFQMTRCLLPLQTVGESLLYMLEKCLGPDFTPATRTAWSRLYGAVVQAMSRGWDGE